MSLDRTNTHVNRNDLTLVMANIFQTHLVLAPVTVHHSHVTILSATRQTFYVLSHRKSIEHKYRNHQHQAFIPWLPHASIKPKHGYIAQTQPIQT